MAIGLTPKFKQDYPLENLDQKSFIVLATEAIKKLNWNLRAISEDGLIAFTNFSWRSYGEEISMKIEDGIASIQSSCTGNQMVDWGKNKKNVTAFLSQIEAEKTSLSQEDMTIKLEELQLQLNMVNDEQTDELASKEPATLQNFFSIFIPTEGYFVTPILIISNILVFILMLVSGVNLFQPENEELLFWGANFRPYTLDGQYWRLFTSCFVHIGILHLLLNMYALVYIGLLLEPYLGKTRMLAAYIITGIAASLASLWWNELTISAGASGAIFGMYGVFLALLTTKLMDKTQQKTLLTSIVVYIGYNLVYGLRPNSGIDNAAHIGGLVSGLLIGYSFVPSLKAFENRNLKAATIGVLLLVLSVSGYSICTTLPNDIANYEKEMKRFVSMELMALEVFNLPEGTSKDSILTEIKDRGLYYWNENLQLLQNFDKADLPEAIKKRNEKLKEYCQVRIKSYETIYKSVEEETDQYQQEIQKYNQQIEKLISEIAGDQLKP